MPIQPNGWNTDWNKPEDELEPHEKAARQWHLRNLRDADRLNRLNSAPDPTVARGVQAWQRQQEEVARQRAEDEDKNKKERERKEMKQAAIAGLGVVSLIVLLCGMYMKSADRASLPSYSLVEHAGTMVAFGTLGLIVTIILIVVAISSKSR